MERLTKNKPVYEMSMTELAYNGCYAKDGVARYRDYERDVDARQFARDLYKNYTDGELSDSNDIFDDEILEEMQFDPETHLGALIALFYRNLWAMADLRERLKAYEETGITPEQMIEIDRMYRELCERLAQLEAEKNHQVDEIKWLSWLTLEEWGEIKCPMLDNKPVMTFYHKEAPCYYSYTAPFVLDGEVFCYRYDHDEGGWDEDTMFFLGDYESFIKSYNGGTNGEN